MKPSTKDLFALVAGGFIGAVLRFEIGEWMPYAKDGFPWSTLIINLLGCFFLGWFLTITLEKIQLRPEIRLGLSTGMTGAFTTFSTFSVQSAHLLMIGHAKMAFLYMISSAMIGIILTFLGVALAGIQSGNRKGGLYP